MKIKKLLASILALTLVTGAFTGCGTNEKNKVNDDKKKTTTVEKKDDQVKGTLNVFAAASLKISLEKIIKDFNKQYPDVSVKLNTDGSDKLFNQMKEGAPADIFISASVKWMNEAVSNNLINKEDQKPFLKNEVVLIKNKNAKDIKLADIKDGKDLCLGAESVPVGGYSKKYFESTGQWDKIKKDTSFEPKVTDVVKKVAEGARNYGLVYRTDANSEIKNGTISVVDQIPAESGIKVIYPIGITKNTQNKDAAKVFEEFLSKGTAKDILEDVGFVFANEK